MSSPKSASRILAYTSPAWGHLSPIVPVVAELTARGHTLRLCTLAQAVEPLQKAGIDAVPIAAAIEHIHHDDWKASSPVAAQKRAMAVFAARAALDAADLQTAVVNFSPDLVLVDVMALGALAAAEASGLPYVVWLPYPAWIRRPGVPPYGPGLAPLAGPPGRLRDALLRPLTARAGSRFTAAANAGRAATGLGSIGSPEEILLGHPRVISMTSPVLEYPGAWPESFHLVGPLAWDPPAPTPDWLSEDQRPIVLVSTSSEFQRDEVLVRTAFEALGARDDVLVVATLPGGGPNRVNDLEVPLNGRVERFAAHSAILPRCQAVICHGGAGITQRAIAAGVPVVAVPFGRDQLEVARRVEVIGAGVRLPARRLSPPRLAAALERAEARRDRARSLALEITKDGGASAAADAVAAELRAAQPSVPPVRER